MNTGQDNSNDQTPKPCEQPKIGNHDFQTAGAAQTATTQQTSTPPPPSMPSGSSPGASPYG